MAVIDSHSWKFFFVEKKLFFFLKKKKIFYFFKKKKFFIFIKTKNMLSEREEWKRFFENKKKQMRKTLRGGSAANMLRKSSSDTRES